MFAFVAFLFGLLRPVALVGLFLVLLAQITIPKLTIDVLVSLAGTILSLAGYYIPPLKRWFDALGEWTPAVMAGILLGITAAYMVLWCNGMIDCMLANWQEYLMIFLASLGTNYATYKGIVKRAKARALALGTIDARRPR